jgi:hypothetical protein
MAHTSSGYKSKRLKNPMTKPPLLCAFKKRATTRRKAVPDVVADAAGVPIAALALTAACSETTIRNVISAGELSAILVNRKLRIPAAAARKFVRAWRKSHRKV